MKHLIGIAPRYDRVNRPPAFTLVEVLLAVSVLGLLAGGSLWALAQANQYAAVARLYTGAQTVAQNQIDLILSEGPFNPQHVDVNGQKDQIPAVLQLGTSIAAPAPTIYSEPKGADGATHTIAGTMTTKISQYTPALQANGIPLDLYLATVTVTFQYRGRNYQVQLNALRASDV